MADNVFIAEILNGMAKGFMTGMQMRQDRAKQEQDFSLRREELDQKKEYMISENTLKESQQMINIYKARTDQFEAEIANKKAEWDKASANEKNALTREIETLKVDAKRNKDQLDFVTKQLKESGKNTRSKNQIDAQKYIAEENRKTSLKIAGTTKPETPESAALKRAQAAKALAGAEATASEAGNKKMIPREDKEKFIESMDMPKALTDFISAINNNRDQFGPGNSLFGARGSSYMPSVGLTNKAKLLNSSIKDFTLKYTKATNGSRPTDVDQRNSEMVAPKISDQPELAIQKAVSMYRKWAQKYSVMLKVNSDLGFDVSAFDINTDIPEIPGLEMGKPVTSEVPKEINMNGTGSPQQKKNVDMSSVYPPKVEAGIQAVMKAKGLSRDRTLILLKKAGKL